MNKESVVRWTPAVVVVIGLAGNIITIGKSMEKWDNVEKRVTKIESSEDARTKEWEQHLVAQARTEEQYKAIMTAIQDLKDGQGKLDSEIRRTHPQYHIQQ